MELYVDRVWGDGRSTVCVAALLLLGRWPWSRASAAKRSNHRHGETFRRTVLALVREHYADFGPTLASEKLAARHGLRVGVETLRQWMIADGLWVDRRHRLPSPHQPRRRRDCLGELVQIDGSEHAWFEDRGPMCTLLAFVDDATSRLMASAVRHFGIGVRLLPHDAQPIWRHTASRSRSTATSITSSG